MISGCPAHRSLLIYGRLWVGDRRFGDKLLRKRVSAEETFVKRPMSAGTATRIQIVHCLEKCLDFGLGASVTNLSASSRMGLQFSRHGKREAANFFDIGLV